MNPGNPLAGNPPASGCRLLDMVYEPATTPLMAEAARRGAVVVGGVEMLLRQMLAQFRILTGVEADPRPLRAALAAARPEEGE